MIHQILSEINASNSTNHKLSVLKQYRDVPILQRVLKMAYDTVDFTYGITVPQVEKFAPSRVTSNTPIDLSGALDILQNDLSSRKVTGHAALQLASDIINSLDARDADVFKKIINRDLRVNMGKTLISKVWPNLINKPVYMRCDVYSTKTAKNIQFPAVLQLKADGTYREFIVKNGSVTSRSRSGESYEYPVIFEAMRDYPEGVYTGELTVRGILDRGKGNGLINSDEPPHDDILLDVWDYITLDEYTLAGNKSKVHTPKTTYKDRWAKLVDIVTEKQGKNIRLIDSHVVNSLQEALRITADYMNSGFEGSILKDYDLVFKDGTSKKQLKLKLKIDCEMRITGFQEGTVGTKRDGKIGSILFENDEGTIRGKTSGFTDEELDEFSAKQSELIGKIISVQFNDLSKAEGNDYYALSHPRFIEIRYDKNETDTLEKVLSLREMAMALS